MQSSKLKKSKMFDKSENVVQHSSFLFQIPPTFDVGGLVGPGIPQLGFENLIVNYTIVGFQVPIVCEYYRGTYVSLLEYFDVTVDGKTYPRNITTCTFGDITINQDQLDGNLMRWPFAKPCYLRVMTPGGLSIGVHEVSVEYLQRISYMTNPRIVRTAAAKLAIGL